MMNHKFTNLLLSAAMCASGAFAQSTFPSASAACQSLVDAVKSDDVQAIDKILGGANLASSKNDDQDKMERQMFLEKYGQMHRISRDPDGSMTLYIGAENWPFPIPLVQENGAWRFDKDAGAKEIMYRRVGKNEFAAIQLCHEFVAAKKQNTRPAQDSDPTLAKLLTTESAGSDPVLSHGYYFRVLSANRPGHLVLIAYPAEYRSSGVMTFAVTEKNIVYEKDLAGSSSVVKGFKKDGTWQNAENEK